MNKTKNILQKSIITVCAFLMMIIAVNGQEEKILLKDNAYYYQGKKHEITDLGNILYYVPEASLLYVKGKKKYTSAKTLGTVAIVGIVVGTVSFSRKNPDNLNELGTYLIAKTFGALAVGTGVVCGIAYFTRRSKGIEYMNDAVGVFNLKNHSTSYRPNVGVGITSNGVGLVLNF